MASENFVKSHRKFSPSFFSLNMSQSSGENSDEEFVDSESTSVSESETESIPNVSSELNSDSNSYSDSQPTKNINSKKFSNKRFKSEQKPSTSLKNGSNSKKSYSSGLSSYLMQEKYVSGSDLSLESDSESDTDSNPSTNHEEIEKIIGINQSTFSEQPTTLKFYVKFKNLSYIHCSWVNKKQLCHDMRGLFLYNNFLKNRTPFRQVNFFNQIESETIDEADQLYKPASVEFDKGYITPEKVISIQSQSGENQFLIKWISLDYDQSTWENDAPQNLIQEYIESNSNTHSPIYNNEINQNTRTFIPIKESPVYKNDHILTDYQVDGLNWLQICWFQNRNSILADEMGLGKTIESISLLDALSKFYPSCWGPFLVVCPLSTISNWLDEFDQWTDFRVVSLLGNPLSRKVIKENMIYRHEEENDLIDKENIIFDVLIVTYESLVRELAFIKKFNFMYTIIDEAQRIKNAKTAIYKHCTSINSFHFLLMTGTPIQNDLFEIWSLLHFIEPNTFTNYAQFNQVFGAKDPGIIERLQEVLRPYIFRRKKNDVNLELPEKEETIIEVEMTHIQRTFSQLLIKDNVDILSDLSTYKSNLKNIMMELRKLFCHPFLIPKLESLCLSEYRESNKIPPNLPLSEENEINALISASGKTILIDKLLPKLKEGNHKVLIFSQMTRMLDIIEDYLVFRHYTYERIDGNCSNAKRAMSIENFQNDDNIFVFLLSTRAGGLGINLTSADTVILYDCDWNPQNDIQAQSRCHRIGQSNKVNVYRLITRGCYESEMFSRASKKLALDFAILDSDPRLLNLVNENENESLKNSRLELQMILRKGAYYTFNDDPNEIDKFCSENIEQILEHRSHTRKDMVSGGKSRFSKVSFDVAGDTEIAKSNFWENLIGSKENTEIGDIDLSFDSGIKTRKKKVKFSEYDDRKKKKKKPKKNSDSITDSDSDDKNDDDDEKSISSGTNSSSGSSSDYSSSYSYYSASDQEFVLSENKHDEEDDDEEEDLIPDDDYDDLSFRNKSSPRPMKSSSSKPYNSLINAIIRPQATSVPPNPVLAAQSLMNNAVIMGSNNIYMNYNPAMFMGAQQQVMNQQFQNANFHAIPNNLLKSAPATPISSGNLPIYLGNQQIIPTNREQSVSKVNQNQTFNQNPTPKQNPTLNQNPTPKQNPTLNQNSAPNQNPTLNQNSAPNQNPTLNQNPTPKLSPAPKKTNSPTVIIVSDSSDYSDNLPAPPSNDDDSSLSKEAVSSSIKVPTKPESAGESDLDIKIAEHALQVISSHGIGASRFFLDDYTKELAKSLAFIAFTQLQKPMKDRYQLYINQFIPNGSKLISTEPFIKFKDPSLIKILYQGQELQLIQNSYHKDFYYKAAIYISNEILPKNYEFAPDFDTPSGWTPIEDFIALTSIPFTKKIEDIVNNEKLPFHTMKRNFNNMHAWMSLRMKIIAYEISTVMPRNYDVYEFSGQLNKYIPKQLINVEMFKAMNPHVIQPAKLNVNLQKKLLRILYFYGIPKINGIKKIKELLRSNYVSDKLILIFTVKILKKAIKYQSDLSELLSAMPKIENSFIESNNFVNIDWIKENAIKSVSFNLNMFFQVRENFKWLNSDQNTNMKLIELPEWKEIKTVLFCWNLNCDLIMFNLTAYYGFLFNSVFCTYFKDINLTPEQINFWKEKEVLSLAPIKMTEAKALYPIFDIEKKKKRISQMIYLIKIARSKEKTA